MSKNNKNKKSNNSKNKSNKNLTNSAQKSTENKKASSSEKAKQDILKQYGLEEEYKPSKEELEVYETEKQNAKQKGKVASKADDIGWNKWKVLLRNALFGIFMGVSDGIPGYSGGTTLNIIGFYKDLVSNVKLIFKPDVKKYFWKYLIWVIPFVVAWLAIMIGFSFLVDFVGDNNQGVILVFLFGFFALFAIPLFYISNKDKCFDFKDFLSKSKNRDKSTIIVWILMISAFLIITAIGIIARFVAKTEIVDESGLTKTIHGVTFYKNANIDPNSFLSGDPVSTVLPLLVLSVASGFVVLIPGISGSLVLYMGNWYPKISMMISNVVSGEFIGESMPYLIVVAAGLILGIILSSFVINYLMNKFEKYFYIASLGFVAGSFVSIFVSLSSYDYSFLSSNSTTLGLSISMIPIALIVNILIFIALNETGRINYPKFKIFKKHANKEVVKN